MSTTTAPARFHGRIPPADSHEYRAPPFPAGRYGITRTQNDPADYPNVGDYERLASVGLGGAMIACGLTKATIPGFIGAALGGCLIYRGMSGQCQMYRALGVSTAEDRGPVTSVPQGRGIRVESSVIVRKPAREIYAFWRRLENLPRFMKHLESVTEDGERSHWKAKAPLGMTVSWDAELYNDRPNELIAWRSLPGSLIASAGSVHFDDSDGNGRTTVRVVLKYDPPGGRLGEVVANWFGESPQQQIDEDLNGFKEQMEKGG